MSCVLGVVVLTARRRWCFAMSVMLGGIWIVFPHRCRPCPMVIGFVRVVARRGSESIVDRRRSAYQIALCLELWMHWTATRGKPAWLRL